MPFTWQCPFGGSGASLKRVLATLSLRRSALSNWINCGALPLLPWSALSQPRALLAAAQQSFARVQGVPLDAVALTCQQWTDAVPMTAIEEGVFFSGLALDEAEELAAGSVPQADPVEVRIGPAEQNLSPRLPALRGLALATCSCRHITCLASRRNPCMCVTMCACLT